MTRRTRIVATLGPASESPEMIARLIDAGVDVFRMNFSHGDHDWHRTVFTRIRKAAAEAGCHIAILQDLQGPRIRTGKLQGGGPVVLVSGARLTITKKRIKGNFERISTTWPRLIDDTKKGATILIADGTLELKVVQSRRDELVCEVVRGGMLGEHKGMNLPDTQLSAKAMTTKDRKDLALGMELGVDAVALSFVRSAADVQTLNRAIKKCGDHRVLTIAKIEHPRAVENIDAILEEADGLMVARGDLGIEMPIERVPVVQKALIDAANARAKPVITATQMLESMMNCPRPTRAESTDVANAVFDGTDAVMLSGETAVGTYPLETVQVMDRIARAAEQEIDRYDVDSAERDRLEQNVGIARAICDAAVWSARELDAAGLVVLTRSGHTARRLAYHRVHMPILVLTPDDATSRKLSLVWGLTAQTIGETESTDLLARQADQHARRAFGDGTGRPVVMVAGTSVLPGATNMVRILTL